MGNCKCKEDINLNQEITSNTGNVQESQDNSYKKLKAIKPTVKTSKPKNYFRK